ncbi:MAG: flavin reductase family protein [Clostridia bacterium]|nr:flavin reductase family protein [Clostridia bacterium]
MRKDLETKDGIFPMPVLMIATYNEDGSVDVMNAAWGTMLDTGLVLLNISESHRTTQNILARRAFTVSIPDAKHATEADWFGVVSANGTPDKFERSGLTAVPSSRVDAPVIAEFPLCMECEFVTFLDEEYAAGVVGKVVNVSADESVMTDGKVDIDKAEAIAYDPYTHGYYKVSGRAGNAFRDGYKLKK